MDAQAAVVRFMLAYWGIWHRAFPKLHKRAHWHIVHHLCGGAASRGEHGAPLGELFGLIRQAMLLDDATVRERVAELIEDGWCTVDPPDRTLSARSVLSATPALKARYAETLLGLLGALATAAPGLEPGLSPHPPAELAPPLRTLALRAIALGGAQWDSLQDRFFEAQGTSPARRLEARRHLLSTSHRTLLLAAIEHALTADAASGILADRLGAQLLETTGQNFQTTRDHLAYLMTLGLLQRGPGRALSVMLAPAALPHVHAALAEGAAALAALAREFTATAPDVHRLRVEAPGETTRLIPLTTWPVTIGRTEANAIALPDSDISRAHCRLDLRESGAVLLTDNNSTNGTVLNGKRLSAPAALQDGAVITLGRYTLTYIAPEEASDATLQRGSVLATLGRKTA